MNKLSKEKRTHLVLVILITIVVLAGLWFGLINLQQQKLRALDDKKTSTRAKLDRVEQAVKNAETLEADVAQTTKQLAQLEDDMAPGDALSWMWSKINQFKPPYKVEIPQISSPETSKDVDIIPKFPYKQATFVVSGSAYFHEFGRFIADFENHFPYFRIENLSQQPLLADNEREKLQFKLDLITLVKPGAF